MSALGSLVVKLALEYAEYTKGLDKSSQESLKFAQNTQKHFDAAAASGKEFFVGMAQGAATAVAAYVSVGAVVDGLKNSIDSLAELDDMSQKTGSSVENLSRLQKVAAMTGAEFGNVDSAISKLAKGMATVDDESNKTNKALSALGVSSKDITGKLRDPSEVMVDVAKNLQNYKDGAGKAALANDLFGKSGADLLPYLNDVSENVDKFTGVSTEAAQRASELQDKMGLMRTKSSELFESLASDLLPTFIDFIDALNDTNTVSGGLYKDGAITSWADDSAVGVARLIDVLKTIPGIVRAVGGSFESVYADLKLLSSVPSIPKIAFQAATGGNAITDFKNALAERNKVVEDANNRYIDLWNKPANTMEQAVLARIDKRTGANLDARDLQLKAIAASAKNASDETKKVLTYTTGNAPKNTATAENISDCEKLTRSINEKIAASQMELTVGHALTESEKIQSKMLADLATGKIHLTKVELDAELGRLRQLDTLHKSIEANKQIAKLYADAAQVAQTAIDNASKEADANERLAATFGMSKSQIEAQTLARLEEQLAQRSTTGMTLDEIQSLEKLIDAKKRNAAAVGKIDALETAEKANKALIADQEKTVEKYNDIFRNGFADMLNNGMDGWKSFNKSLVTTFKTTVADQIYKMFAQPFVVKMVASLLGVVGGSAASGAANAAGAGNDAIGMASNANSLYNAGSFAANALFGSGSGTVASWMAGTSAVAPTSVLAANAAGAVGGDALGTLIAAEGWTTAAGTAATAAGTAAAGAGAAAEGAAAAAAGAEAAGAASATSALASIPVYGWIAAAVVAVAAYFGGKGDVELKSQGIEGAFGEGGFSGNSFANMHQDGGWFSSDDDWKQTGVLDGATAKSFDKGYTALQASSASAAKALGLSADAITNYSQQISITLTNDAAKNAEAINKVFADVGNNLAAAVAPGLSAFAKDGETASATLSRLSGSITTANAWLSLMRQRLFQVSLAGGDAASKLADAFGGLDNLTAASAKFYDLYYTEGERAARSTADMTAALASFNLSMPVTKDELRNMAASLDLNTSSGRAAYATLLTIAPEYAAVADITAKLAKETADKLMATFTGNGQLMPALDTVFLKAVALTSGMGGLVSSMSDTQVRTLALATGLSEAQIRAGALTSGIGGLVGSMSDTQVRAVALATGLSEAQIRSGALTSGMGGLTGSMTETQVRAVALATGLSEAQIRAGALTGGIGGLVGSMSDTQVRTLALATGLSDAQIRAGALTGGMGGLVGSMSETQVRTLALATGLSETQIRAGALTSGMGSMGQTAGTISTLFLDAKSGLISFNTAGAAIKPIFTGAQLAGILLNAEIDDLRLGADKTRIDIAGLGDALTNVNTETFVSTIGLVFDNLATRIQGVIDSISTERIAVREAALQIINPTVMSKAAIQGGIGAINTKLPSNAGVVSSLGAINAAAEDQSRLDKNKAWQTNLYAPLIDSNLALYNKSRSDSLSSLAAFKGILGTVQKLGSYNETAENFAAGIKFRAGGYITTSAGGQTAQNNNTYAAYSGQFDTAKSALANYTSLSSAYAKEMSLIATQQAAITTRASAAAVAAKAAQLAYTDALQNFAIDASKSVTKLTKLREETVKYYDAQKQLADLMANSAAGLRGTVADYKYNQLSPEQQFNDLQAKYATAYSMALSTDGEALAGYGDKLNSMLNPLLEKAKEVYGTDSAYNSFAATALARAETIAGRLEALTPTNYAADSLLMLGQIDSTLAALDDSSKSAEKLITDAIKAGSDKTAAGLHAVIAALTGQAIPGFATGGDFGGGWRIVGENGPELEATGPSRIFNASQTRSMLAGGGNSARLEALVERQTQELANMRAELRAIAMSNATLAKLADRNYKEGTLVRTETDAPLAAVAA